jgi:hypothetical protein
MVEEADPLFFEGMCDSDFDQPGFFISVPVSCRKKGRKRRMTKILTKVT